MPDPPIERLASWVKMGALGETDRSRRDARLASRPTGRFSPSARFRPAQGPDLRHLADQSVCRREAGARECPRRG